MGDRASAFTFFDSERLVRAEDLTGGYVFGFSTVSGLGKPEFPSQVCHKRRRSYHWDILFHAKPCWSERSSRSKPINDVRKRSEPNNRCTTIPLPLPSPPVAADYCRGFSLDACERMKAQVATGKSPPYCKPGFAIVGNPANFGLTNEQLRICYVTSRSKE